MNFLGYLQRGISLKYFWLLQSRVIKRKNNFLYIQAEQDGFLRTYL